MLGTDMAVHSTLVEAARGVLHTGSPDADVWAANAEHRLLAMKAIMHVADISNAARPPWLAGMWTRAVYDEFFRQGDAEKEMGVDVSPLCDRETVAIAESQVRGPLRAALRPLLCAARRWRLPRVSAPPRLSNSAGACVQKAFLNFVVTPTWDLLRDIAPKSHSLARSLIEGNLAKWMALAERGDATGVINERDPRAPAAPVHVSPIQSPFHSNNQTSWCGPGPPACCTADRRARWPVCGGAGGWSALGRVCAGGTRTCCCCSSMTRTTELWAKGCASLPPATRTRARLPLASRGSACISRMRPCGARGGRWGFRCRSGTCSAV